jgi:hypothetical protein
MRTLYHNSSVEIKKFEDNRPIWFTSNIEDTKRYNDCINGAAKFLYKIQIEDFNETDDYMLFHTGEILSISNKDAVKMNSSDIDNNWFVIKNINKYNPKLIS